MEIVRKVEQSKIIQSIRNGLIMIIPVLLIGSFSLVFKTLPIPGYQNFISSFFSGFFIKFFDFMYNSTFGFLSVYMVASISVSYAQTRLREVNYLFGVPIIALICFGICIGMGSPRFDVSLLGVKGMFGAIVTGIMGTAIYIFCKQKIHFSFRLYADGVDYLFNNSMSVVFPGIITVAICALLNLVFVTLFDVSGFQEFFIKIANSIFDHIGNKFLKGLLFIFLSSIFWFFGIHGSNVLEGVMEHHFTPLILKNAAANFLGMNATEVFSKTFFDVFVLMGGCGVTLCLLFALLLFSKRHCNRNLSKLAIFPMIFNINEIMVFGFPIIFNPYMLVPFIITPLVSLFISYGAMRLNIVPIPCHEVTWTTPVLLGGYIATGSIRGSLLQLFNLIIGVFIYLPFVKKYDSAMEKKSHIFYEQLVEECKKSEETTVPVFLTEMTGAVGALAKTIVLDLKECITKDEIKMFYQPQYDNKDNCIGVEALMRWKHNVYGFIYPPLVIKLAEESGILTDLEKIIINKVFKDAPAIHRAIKGKSKVSVNVTVDTLQSVGFETFLKEKIDAYDHSLGDMCLEITEQMALKSNASTEDLFARVRQMGFKMAIDDFSMGHTSLKYLQTNQFDLVKLDGSLVKAMKSNPRVKDIIASIVYLSQSLGFSVLAEYVETEEQKKELEEIGCLQYQGYLYGAGVPLAYFVASMRTEE